MNKTKIDWADMTWNPVTGCLHNCPYCYAQRIAKRFAGGEAWDRGSSYSEDLHVLFTKPEKPYPFDFEPTLHRCRLNEPQQIKKPQNIFVCSMADLFGEWVPDEWIEEVFKACAAAPQHRYMFLTKNPKRYEQFIDKPMPENMWFGFSQTKNQHIGYSTHPSWKTFVSIEPLLERLTKTGPEGIDWVIIGTETGNRKGKIVPHQSWIEDIVNECRCTGTPVFMKDSLAEIWGEPLIQEYPWKAAT